MQYRTLGRTGLKVSFNIKIRENMKQARAVWKR